MFKKAIGLFAVVALALLPAAASAQLTSYNQDFESLLLADGGALSADGWLVFANVFGPGGTPYYYGYGPFPAPNNAGGFCGLAAGEGGGGQGAQQLVVYSDYNNGAEHAAGNLIESNTFREWTIGVADVGTTWNFSFDAKLGNLAGASTALAFIKTLNPLAGYAMTNFITENMTTTPATWTSYQLSIVIDAGLVGQILQVGFANNATNYDGSGVFYDNVEFGPQGVVSGRESSFGAIKGQFSN